MKFDVIFPKSVEHIFYLYIYKIFLVNMFPSSSDGIVPATEQKTPGSTLTKGGFDFFFENFIFKK